MLKVGIGYRVDRRVSPVPTCKGLNDLDFEPSEDRKPLMVPENNKFQTPNIAAHSVQVHTGSKVNKKAQ
jgi:hypothetical protein